MTLAQAILRADALKPNTYTSGEKAAWLYELDGRVKREIHDTHENMADTPLTGYDAEVNADTALLVPEPYSEIYVYWLFTKIDFLNAETARFNNSALMFNTAWINYANHINRTHAPKAQTKLRRV